MVTGRFITVFEVLGVSDTDTYTIITIMEGPNEIPDAFNYILS